ncbi:MAG TPA: TetR/AcrR family transcriptional regulator [Brevundimonas sp.]|jgi:AcrR family transcriptional regulator|uniref:TetR/AcrR family transcriptional regulator n=1 Tax=Brevundimonas sp. TaxID=1871086 RepID=UPI002ED7C0EA
MQVPADQPRFSDPKRAAILKHARRAFVRDGFAGAKMEPIAREAGVSTATLYAVFEGKAELFAAVIEDAADDFQRLMGHVRSAGGPAPERLTHFATAYARFMSDPFIRSVFRLVMAERPRFRDVAMRFFDRGKSDFGGVLMQALREMDETGELRVSHPSWAAGQLMGMIEHPVFFMPLVTGDEVRAVRDPEEIAADAVETFMARYGA